MDRWHTAYLYTRAESPERYLSVLETCAPPSFAGSFPARSNVPPNSAGRWRLKFTIQGEERARIGMSATLDPASQSGKEQVYTQHRSCSGDAAKVTVPGVPLQFRYSSEER
jgi:hypothetical protein